MRPARVASRIAVGRRYDNGDSGLTTRRPRTTRHKRLPLVRPPYDSRPGHTPVKFASIYAEMVQDEGSHATFLLGQRYPNVTKLASDIAF